MCIIFWDFLLIILWSLFIPVGTRSPLTYILSVCVPCADPKCANYDSAKKNVIAFSGKDDIQSNFYQCNIKFFGISHPSAEHAFQYSKAMRFGDTITASVIQKANSALDAKRIAIKITTPENGCSTGRCNETNPGIKIWISARIQGKCIPVQW